MATDPRSPDPNPSEPADPSSKPRNGDGKVGLDRTDEGQDFVDQSTIDFDPDDGLYSGTAVDGDSEIPGPHQDHETGEVDLSEQPTDEQPTDDRPTGGG